MSTMGDFVFNTSRPRRSVLFIGILLALCIHAGLAALGLAMDPPLEIFDPKTSIAPHTEITLEPPKPHMMPFKPPALKHPITHGMPARATKIVAHDTKPADAGENTFVTGTNTAPAPSGAQAEEGTNTPTPAIPDASASVRLRGAAWDCAWPSQAYSLDIDTQTVVMQVTVQRNGRATSVEILSDPGNGFAEAAIQCAKRTLFEPARNAQGETIDAVSPPIRVRFTR